MKFTLPLIFLLISACSHKQIISQPTTVPSVDAGPALPAPEPSVKPDLIPVPSVPSQTTGSGIRFVSTSSATPAEIIKINQASAKVNPIIQSKCFEDFMMNRKLIQTDGRTNAQVVAHLRSLNGAVPVNFYYKRFTSAVAYRIPGNPTININRKFFTPTMSDCEYVSVMLHEGAGHSLGEYSHDFNYSPSRDYSVPYSLNYASDACCKDGK